MGRRLAGASVEEKLTQNIRIDGECHRWAGAHTPKGYGQMLVSGRVRAVHRLSHEIRIGPIPEGFEVDHRCRVRDCINPAHLEAVTHAENVRRQLAYVTHCVNGHEFTPDNIRWTKVRGYRVRRCQTCYKAGRAAIRARERAERSADHTTTEERDRG